MQLNELLEEYSLTNISKKTRIAPENLQALFDGNWEKLQKVQALGFISILEREYGLDLSDLRNACKAYYETHHKGEEQISVVPDEPISTHAGGWLGKGIVLVFLGLLAYGGWYFFIGNNRAFQGTENNATPRSESFFGSVIHTVDGWIGSFGGTQTPENSIEEPPAVHGAWAKKTEQNRTQSETKPKTETTVAKTQAHSEKTTVVSDTATEKPRIDQNETIPNETPSVTENPSSANASEDMLNNPSEDEAIIKRVKAQEARKERQQNPTIQDVASPSVEENLSDNTQEQVSKMIAAATAINTPKSTREHVVADSKQAKTKKATETKSAQNGNKRSETKAAQTSQIVVLHPLAKIWVGYTQLHTMKRFAGVTNKNISFDTKKGDYIVATGHGKLEFTVGKTTLLKRNDGKKHYFMIAKGAVREISHGEFQRLNRSKVW
ncbi:hypothetical protein [Nitratifractor sp.]